MWKPNKNTLFFLVFANTTLAGISLTFVNWDVVKSGGEVYQEIATPLIFFCLAIYFIFPYVKELKKKA